MANNKQPRKITVKNPKIGTKYYFRFAGSVYYGPIVENCLDLSEKVGTKYFMFNSDSDSNGNKTSYPILINEIAINEEDLKYKNNV